MKFKIMILFAVVLTVSCILFGTGIGVNAAEVIDNGDYVYRLDKDGKSLSIMSYKGNSLYVKLPSKVDKYVVKSVDSAAFMYNDTIKELEISNTIETIHSNAFSECTALKKLIVPENVREIGDSAFSSCKLLKTVKIAEGLKKIGNYCFAGCEKLSELTLPKKIGEIGEYAFFGCSSLENIDLPQRFDRLGSYALEGTKWMGGHKEDFVIVGGGILLKYNGKGGDVVIPDGVKIIGECAFDKNDAVRSIVMSKSVEKIGKSAFGNCSILQKAVLSDNISVIEERAFENCVMLSEIELPQKLGVISEYCFSGCSSLTFIKVPDSVKKIERYAFSECIRLENADIGTGVEKIEDHVFDNCTNLKKLEFPESLKEISSYAGYNCHSLTRVEFKSDVEVPSLVFSDCAHLEEAVFYQKPKSIDVNAFNHCSDKFSLYSSDKNWLEKYAKENKYELKGVNQLNLYKDRGILKADDGEKSMLSGGHTALIVIILAADCGVVIFFGLYVLFSKPPRRAKRKVPAGAQRQTPRHSKEIKR